MTELCDWCETNSGRTHATQPCCILRRLALAPRHVQAAHGAALSEEDRAALRPRLLAEMKRLNSLRTGAQRPDNNKDKK